MTTYKNIESLEPIKKVLNEADIGLKDKNRSIATSSIPNVLGAALGAGLGGAASFAMLFFGGSVVGLSAAGITSGLAAAGGLLGGGMASGVAIMAAPVAILGVAGYGLVAAHQAQKLKEAKESLIQEIIRKQNAVLEAKNQEINQTKERAEYLQSINIILEAALRDLKADLNE